MEKRTVTVLGSTGSVGRSTLDVLSQHPDRFAVTALAAGSDWKGLAAQARAFRPAFVALADARHLQPLREALSDLPCEVQGGADSVIEAARRDADIVMAAIVGAAGLRPTLEAIARGATIAIANKETLVCAGDLVLEAVARHGARLIPVDSEHSAIFQVLAADQPEAVDRIILTCSGGPFREWPAEAIAAATPEQAVQHPNWQMGAKISVDSATLMNKGLELIEAVRLFPVTEGQVEVVIHPQSVIHSLVSYADGSVLAQLGEPDMRTPIAVALAWPERITAGVGRLDLVSSGPFTFEEPDHSRFPALGLARAALREGGSMPAVLNAANEVAVQAFLDGRLGFPGISDAVAAVMDRFPARPLPSLHDVHHIDQAARDAASAIIDAGPRSQVPVGGVFHA